MMFCRALLVLLVCIYNVPARGGTADFLKQIDLVSNVTLGMPEADLRNARPQLKRDNTDLGGGNYTELAGPLMATYDLKDGRIDRICVYVSLKKRDEKDGLEQAKQILRSAFSTLGDLPQLYREVSGKGEYETSDHALLWLASQNAAEYLAVLFIDPLLEKTPDSHKPKLGMMVWVGSGINPLAVPGEAKHFTEIAGEMKPAMLARLRQNIKEP